MLPINQTQHQHHDLAEHTRNGLLTICCHAQCWMLLLYCLSALRQQLQNAAKLLPSEEITFSQIIDYQGASCHERAKERKRASRCLASAWHSLSGIFRDSLCG